MEAKAIRVLLEDVEVLVPGPADARFLQHPLGVLQPLAGIIVRMVVGQRNRLHGRLRQDVHELLRPAETEGLRFDLPVAAVAQHALAVYDGTVVPGKQVPEVFEEIPVPFLPDSAVKGVRVPSRRLLRSQRAVPREGQRDHLLRGRRSRQPQCRDQRQQQCRDSSHAVSSPVFSGSILPRIREKDNKWKCRKKRFLPTLQTGLSL